MINYYIIHVVGDIQPELWGPYELEEEADDKARELGDKNSQNTVLWAEVNDNEDPVELQVGSYPDKFFKSRG
jgi:hypothetical protein